MSSSTKYGTTSLATVVTNPPSIVEWKYLKFVLMDAPNDTNVSEYIAELTKNRVVHVIRLCEEKTYDPAAFDNSNIEVHAWPFADGDPPPAELIDNWLRYDG
jgi:protein tyrosine phosphatase type 4A